MSTVSISEASRHLSRIVNKAAYGQEFVVLTSRGQAKAVLMGIDAFEHLVGTYEYAQRPLKPLDTLRLQVRQALGEAGYDSRESIVALVRDVKHEMSNERTQPDKHKSFVMPTANP